MTKTQIWDDLQSYKAKYNRAKKTGLYEIAESYREMITKNYIRYIDMQGQKKDEEIRDIVNSRI